MVTRYTNANAGLSMIENGNESSAKSSIDQFDELGHHNHIGAGIVRRASRIKSDSDKESVRIILYGVRKLNEAGCLLEVLNTVNGTGTILGIPDVKRDLQHMLTSSMFARR